jgi:hypothetical protein
VQFNIGNQEPVEPVFKGQVFVNLGADSGIAPVNVSLATTSNQGYGTTSTYLQLVYDQVNQTLWMNKAADLSFVRVAGSHRDFPFDSAKFDYQATFTPPVALDDVLLRNTNSGFYMPCGSVSVTNTGTSGFHIIFELKRNPLVQLTATVLIIAAFLFLLAIVVSVKKESLATAIASFFFSLWSIRAILSSEMKAFPTLLDLGILSLCVLLLVLMGVRLGLEQWKSPSVTSSPHLSKENKRSV